MDRIIYYQFPEESQFLQLVGQYIFKLYDALPLPLANWVDSVPSHAANVYTHLTSDKAGLIFMYIHLLTSALFPIWIGSHASLRRPPGDVCKDPKKIPFAPQGTKDEDEDDDDDDELDEGNNVEGLTPSDAIMFPVLAGFTLAGLYFLIKWLDNPNILNRILGWYFSCLGVFGIGKLAADGLNLGTTFIFPTAWASGKDVYLVEPLLRRQVIAADTPFKAIRGGVTQHKTADVSGPLPGLLSGLKYPKPAKNLLWSLRALFTERWILKAYVHGLASIKTHVRLNDVTGFSIGVAAIAVYNLAGKSWWLTNLMGFGFCYGTLQLMSPTTFWTGSLVLMGLFVYDVVMVFYTPMMVSVATTLDVPIKLVFPGPKHGGMLGLGDVVLPGIMIALALRFDLYMFYLRKKQALALSKATSEEKTPVRFNFTKTDVGAESDKITYQSATGFQGDRYWTAPSTLSLLPFPFTLFISSKRAPGVPTDILGGIFPKPYFYSSIVGYIAGMLVTLFVLNAYNHAQPALLYLVPGVLGSLWLTSLVRGEYREMWNYSEDNGLFDDTSKKTKDGKITEGQIAKMSLSELQALVPEDEKETSMLEAAKKKAQEDAEKAKVKANEHAHHVFLISLSKPRANNGPTGVFAAAETK